MIFYGLDKKDHATYDIDIYIACKLIKDYAHNQYAQINQFKNAKTCASENLTPLMRLQIVNNK